MKWRGRPQSTNIIDLRPRKGPARIKAVNINMLIKGQNKYTVAPNARVVAAKAFRQFKTEKRG